MSLQWQNDEDKMRCQNVYRNEHDTMCGAGCAQFHYYHTILNCTHTHAKTVIRIYVIYFVNNILICHSTGNRCSNRLVKLCIPAQLIHNKSNIPVWRSSSVFYYYFKIREVYHIFKPMAL